MIDSLAPARSVAMRPSFRYAAQIPFAVSQTAQVLFLPFNSHVERGGPWDAGFRQNPQNELNEERFG
jgi:hypothetical protein